MPEPIESYGVNIEKVMKLLRECPKCNSLFAGKLYGSIEIKGYYITKECQCGFKLNYDMRNGKTTKAIQAAIDKVHKAQPKVDKRKHSVFVKVKKYENE